MKRITALLLQVFHGDGTGGVIAAVNDGIDAVAFQ